ncbi:MAG: Gfo/Idh/MocA family oxidoreductase [Pseudomonadota bacterium]
MTEVLRVGLAGAGVFGSFHAGKIAGAPGVLFSGVYDRDTERAAMLAGKYGCPVPESHAALFDASDTVIIATPATTHALLVGEALRAGCHVLVEKPLALSADDAIRLVEEAKARQLVLQVGHQERMVCAALGLFDVEEIPISIKAVRIGTPPQNQRCMDVSVIWDVMIHDLDIAHKLAGPGRELLSSRGEALLGTEIDRAEADLLLSSCRASFVADRTAKDRQRLLEIEYESGCVTMDLLNRSVHNTTRYTLKTDFSSLVSDPLGAADAAFIAACQGKGDPAAPAEEAAWAVASAERIEQMALMHAGALHG